MSAPNQGAKAGPVIHCDRLTVTGIPTAADERIVMGWLIGFGMTSGGVTAVAVIVLIGKALGALFS